MAIDSNGVRGIKSADSFNGPRRESPLGQGAHPGNWTCSAANRICLCGESTHPRCGSVAGRCELPKTVALHNYMQFVRTAPPGVFRVFPRRPSKCYRVTCCVPSSQLEWSMNGSRLFAHLMYVGVPVLAAGQKNTKSGPRRTGYKCIYCRGSHSSNLIYLNKIKMQFRYMI